jgi:predicted methyltransferase
MMRYCTALAAVLATAFAIFSAGSAHDFVAEPGAPAAAFPKADRPVANIVSPIWHDEKERDAADEPAQLVRLRGIKSGITIADIGAGSGYYVARLSPIVGAGGRIIAEDIKPEYLRSLRKQVRDLGLQNVTVSLGEPHDPRLPADSVDVAILVHMYHEITQPPTPYFTISCQRSSPARGSGLSTHSRQRPSTARRPVSCGVSLQP